MAVQTRHNGSMVAVRRQVWWQYISHRVAVVGVAHDPDEDAEVLEDVEGVPHLGEDEAAQRPDGHAHLVGAVPAHVQGRYRGSTATGRARASSWRRTGACTGAVQGQYTVIMWAVRG